jgi:hypothetical protein
MRSTETKENDMASPAANAALQNVTNVAQQVFVDVCTDNNAAYLIADYRLGQGGTIIAVYSAPEAEARYVTAVPAAGPPVGTALPLPIAATWIVVSSAAP